MRQKGDMVKWKKHWGKYRLWRFIVSAKGVEGWVTTGPDGALHYIREDEIK